MANSNPASMRPTAPASPDAVWFDNANTVSPGTNSNFTFDRGQRPSANMSHSHFQGFWRRNGHGRTRSTITIPRSSWFNDSNLPNSATAPVPVFPASDYANELAAGHSYCLDRGNGEFTRLIPADLLPALNEVPARETRPHGMVILPSLGMQTSNPSLTAQVRNTPIVCECLPLTRLTCQNECVTSQKPQVNNISSILQASLLTVASSETNRQHRVGRSLEQKKQDILRQMGS